MPSTPAAFEDAALFGEKMATWLQRLAGWLRIGSMPDEFRAQLESEGLLVLAERIRVTVIYRNFKAPGRRYSGKHAGALGSLGLSTRRIVGFAFSQSVIHVPYDHPKFKAITLKAEHGKYLSASFDASEFNADHSGNVEIRFYLPNVAEAIKILRTYT